MDSHTYFYPACVVLAMFTSALNAKTLGVNIAFCMGLATFYPFEEPVAFMLILYVPAILVASFRE